jgi:hypothetical protein
VGDPNGTPVRAEFVEIVGGGTYPSGFEVGRTWVVADGLRLSPDA